MHLWLTIEGEVVRLSSGLTIALLLGAVYGCIRLILDPLRLLTRLIAGVAPPLQDPPTIDEVISAQRERARTRGR
jgi:hypothetical protein